MDGRMRVASSQGDWLLPQAMRNEQAEEPLTPVAPQASMASVDELTALDGNAEGAALLLFPLVKPRHVHAPFVVKQ